MRAPPERMSVGFKVESTCTALSSYSASSNVASTTSRRWRAAACAASVAISALIGDPHQGAAGVAARQHGRTGLRQLIQRDRARGDAIQMPGLQVTGDALPDQKPLVAT